VRVEQGSADVSPWPFGAGPRAKELDWIATRLSPLPIDLQCLVQAPAEIIFPFHIGDVSFRFRVCLRSTRYCLIPALFPAVESDSGHLVDVCSSAELVMANHTRLEENADKVCLTESGVHSESFQNSF